MCFGDIRPDYGPSRTVWWSSTNGTHCGVRLSYPTNSNGTLPQKQRFRLFAAGNLYSLRHVSATSRHVFLQHVLLYRDGSILVRFLVLWNATKSCGSIQFMGVYCICSPDNIHDLVCTTVSCRRGDRRRLQAQSKRVLNSAADTVWSLSKILWPRYLFFLISHTTHNTLMNRVHILNDNSFGVVR